jgi:hypothetical protein
LNHFWVAVISTNSVDISYKMKSFAEAQTAAIIHINSEPADTGMHYAWIQRKAHFAKEMTQETMRDILKSNPKGLTDDSAKFGVAQLIQHLMKHG